MERPAREPNKEQLEALQSLETALNKLLKANILLEITEATNLTFTLELLDKASDDRIAELAYMRLPFCDNQQIIEFAKCKKE